MVLTEVAGDAVRDRGWLWLGVTQDWRWLVGAGRAAGAPARGIRGCELFSYSFAKST